MIFNKHSVKKFAVACLFILSSLQVVLAQRKAFEILNPVIDRDYADPTVIRANGKYYAYATQGNREGKSIHIMVSSSTNLQNWKFEGDALPVMPNWSNSEFWAPHVVYDKQLKKYILFYSGESTDDITGKCLGVAFADKPEGPFIDKGSPLICGSGFINIDPFAFIDPKSGKKLLYWGSDFKPLKVQELTDDWKSFKPGTSPTDLVAAGQEKNYTILLEGSWIDFHKGKYYLYYSGDNCCGVNANYAVMVARADNAFGPFIRMGAALGINSSVILAKTDKWLAPGHNSIFRDNKGNVYMAYHAIRIDKTDPQFYDKGRLMMISPVVYKNGWPVVKY